VEIRGEHRFHAARQITWDALLDPVSLKAALPECESFNETGPGQYAVKLRAGVAAIKGTYTGSVIVSDEQPANSYQLSVTASGKPGRVKGSAEISLRDDGDETVVDYVADITVQGVLARLGSRLLGGAAKLMASQFFRSMEKQVANRAP
jgi:uncharacterized protein